MERSCDACGDPYEAKTKRSRFCGVNCRVAAHKAGGQVAEIAAPASVSTPPRPPSTKIRDRLFRELTDLGVVETYEAEIVLGLAEQLDSRVIVGSAYVSQSKEVDRRVDALRMKAERPDDPAKAVKDRLAEKRLRLA